MGRRSAVDLVLAARVAGGENLVEHALRGYALVGIAAWQRAPAA